MSDDDKTKIAFQRPQLGGGPSPPPETPPPAGRPQLQPRVQRGAPGAQPYPQAAAVETASLDALVDGGEGRLVGAAMSLLLLAARLRHTAQHRNVGELKNECANRIRKFEQDASQLGYGAKHLSAARYALCTLLDEAVMKTPWGGSSGWSSQSLLMVFHGETWGGDKFFQIVERIKQDPGEYLDLIELCYFCLALGLVGRYGVESGGAGELNSIRDDLFRILLARRPTQSEELSPNWRGIEDRTSRIVRWVPAWVLALIALSVFIFAFLWFRGMLNAAAEPVATELAQIGLEPYQPPRRPVRQTVELPPAPRLPTLPELLSTAEARGLLALETEGRRTRIMISFNDLFASARAEVNPAYAELWAEVAAALNQVPGRVLVVGHTDDRPLRSLTFKDNFELSRARAATVTDILKQHLDNPARLEFTGVGPTQPRFKPVNVKENRDRNRRVEISHWSEEGG